MKIHSLGQYGIIQINRAIKTHVEIHNISKETFTSGWWDYSIKIKFSSPVRIKYKSIQESK